MYIYVTLLEYGALLKRYQGLLNNLVTADMDFTQLDAFLTSQVKKRQVILCFLSRLFRFFFYTQTN